MSRVEDVVHAGYVQMHGKLGMVKRKRYFALDQDIQVLRICRSEKDLANRQTLPLAEIAHISQDGPRFTLHFAESATPPNNGRTYTAICKTADEAADWITAIETVRMRAEEDDFEPEDEDEDLGFDGEEELDHEADEFEIEEGYDDVAAPGALNVYEEDHGYVADLTFFEFLGGRIADHGNLLWIGALPKPVKKSALSKLRDSLRKSLSRSSKPKAKAKAKKAKAEKATAKKAKAEEVPLEEEVTEDEAEVGHGAGDSERAALGQLIAKNLASKSSKGAPKYAAPPPKGGRKMHSLGRGLFSKKSSAPQSVVGAPPEGAVGKSLSKDELTQKIARQARQAGGGMYLTGAATVGLADDISKSKLAVSLARRKEENERRKAKEAAAEAKARAEEDRRHPKEPSQPPGKDKLAAFLAQNPGRDSDDDQDFDHDDGEDEMDDHDYDHDEDDPEHL